MTKDYEYEESLNQRMIEILVSNEHTSVWIPVMGTQLYIVNRNGDISKVNAIHVRNFEAERQEDELPDESDLHRSGKDI